MIPSARFIFLFIGTALMCQIVPNFYNTVTRQVARSPSFSYSPVAEKLLVRRYVEEGSFYADLEGKRYSSSEYERLKPLRYYAQLALDGRAPEEVAGVPVDAQVISNERTYIRIQPESYETGLVNLRPLFESASGRVSLEMPSELMRLEDGVEFYLPAENRVDEEMSAQYTAALEAAGVRFPVQRYGTYPTTRKPFDEGFIFEDASGVIFNLKKVKGEPFIARLKDLGLPEQADLWDGLSPKLIEIQEQGNRAIRAVIVDQEDQIWLVTGEQYKLVPVDMETYTPENSRLLVRGDLLTFSVYVRSPDAIEILVMDRDFNVLAQHQEFVPGRQDFAFKARDWLFPLELDYRSRHSNFLGFFFQVGSPFAFLISSLLAAGYAFWAWKTRRWRFHRLLDVVAIVATGFVGLLVAVSIPPTQARRQIRCQ
jgi:uncharacterized protein (DUF1499 family)